MECKREGCMVVVLSISQIIPIKLLYLHSKVSKVNKNVSENNITRKKKE